MKPSNQKATRQQEIFAALRESGQEMSLQELDEATDVGYDNLKQALSDMVKGDLLVRIRRGVYDLPERQEESKQSEDDLPYAPSNGFQLTIYHSVRPSAGQGTIVYEAEEHEAETHKQSKRIFKDLLGFWPPDDMRGMYVDGESMKPGLHDKKLVLYRPVQQMYSGERYILQVEDPLTGDFGLRVKRVVTYAGGGVRIISDNKGLGVPDEELIPENGNGRLVNQATGREVRLHVIGQVLWPSERDEEEKVDLITRTIEQLASQGVLKS